MQRDIERIVVVLLRGLPRRVVPAKTRANDTAQLADAAISASCARAETTLPPVRRQHCTWVLDASRSSRGSRGGSTGLLVPWRT